MKNNSPGTALLIVFFVLTIITLWATNVWRETAYMLDLAHTKQQYEQQFRLTEGLLEYGKVAAQILYKRWQADSSKITESRCSFDYWPPIERRANTITDTKNNNTYSGKVNISRNDNELSIRVQLYKNKSVVCALRCNMIAQEDGECKGKREGKSSFIVQEWSRDVI